MLSLDFQSGEDRYRRIEPADHLTPERLYERTLGPGPAGSRFARLREEFSAAGKSPLFDRLMSGFGHRSSQVHILQKGERGVKSAQAVEQCALEQETLISADTVGAVKACF